MVGQPRDVSEKRAEDFVATILGDCLAPFENQVLDAIAMTALVNRLDAALPRLALARMARDSGIEVSDLLVKPRLTPLLIVQAMAKVAGLAKVPSSDLLARQKMSRGWVSFTFACRGNGAYGGRRADWWDEAVNRIGADAVAARIKAILNAAGVFADVSVGAKGGFTHSLSVKWDSAG